MKLLNKSLVYLSVSLFFIIGLWSVIFYFNMLHEIKESVDEGLDNYKRQIVFKAQTDSTVLTKTNFDEGFFAVREIPKLQATSQKEYYMDTVMYMQDADDEELELEPVRLLTTAFERNGHYYELRVVNSMVEEDDLVDELFREALALYVILIAGIILINNLVLQRLWKPFYSFLNQLKNYRIGSSVKLPEVKTETKEFIDLQQAVVILLQHNIETYEQQKQFTGNASHELQTPLAIIANKLELLVEKGNLQNEQAESIEGIMSIVERLVRLNKSLLLLTKIENKQFMNDRSVLFNSVVLQNVQDLEEVADFKNIKIHTVTSELSVNMDSSLASIIVSNLLRNAIFHNAPNGIVNIELSQNSMRISNSGLQEPLNKHNIFTRFHKSEADQNSTGLGLAIVKAICELYGFAIDYRFENDLHCFEVRFR